MYSTMSYVVQYEIYIVQCKWTSPRHDLLLNLLCGFKSTTITEILSLLPFWMASLERYSAAAWAAGSTPSPLSASEAAAPFFLCHRRILLRATSQTSSFVITSHKPSLAKIRHSSSLARGTNITSGSDITHGLKCLSPVNQKKKKKKKKPGKMVDDEKSCSWNIIGK